MTDSERAEARRQQVLDAAAQCFRAHGFHGASMAQIARTAGMSPGHIYNLFENKEDVIQAIVARDEAHWLALADALRQADDVAQAMAGSVTQGAERCTAPACAALRLEVVAEAGRNAKLAAIVQAAGAASRERLLALLRQALAQRGRTLEPAELRARATVIASLFDGLMVQSVRDPGMDRDAVAALMARVVLQLLD